MEVTGFVFKTILNQQTDFTGEFPVGWAKDGLWRMNESAPDENNNLLDSSGAERPAFINNWSGTTASMRSGQKGNYFVLTSTALPQSRLSEGRQ